MTMPVQTININVAEKQLADLLAIVKNNGEIMISQNGKPLARLESVKVKKLITGQIAE